MPRALLLLLMAAAISTRCKGAIDFRAQIIRLIGSPSSSRTGPTRRWSSSSNKSNLTFRGEDREKVQVGYANNSAFNPPQPGPNRRCAFSVYDSNDIQLENFSVSNYAYGQAEGLLIFGSKNIVSNMNIKGSGDALNLRGTVYLTGSRIIGDGDTILGVGAALLQPLRDSINWSVHVDPQHRSQPRKRFCRLHVYSRERPASRLRDDRGLGSERADRDSQLPARWRCFARLPNNHGLNYPYAEAVLINCHLKGDSARRLGTCRSGHSKSAPLGVQQHRPRWPSHRHDTTPPGLKTTQVAAGRGHDRGLQQALLRPWRLDARHRKVIRACGRLRSSRRRSRSLNAGIRQLTVCTGATISRKRCGETALEECLSDSRACL